MGCAKIADNLSILSTLPKQSHFSFFFFFFNSTISGRPQARSVFSASRSQEPHRETRMPVLVSSPPGGAHEAFQPLGNPLNGDFVFANADALVCILQPSSKGTYSPLLSKLTALCVSSQYYGTSDISFFRGLHGFFSRALLHVPEKG